MRNVKGFGYIGIGALILLLLIAISAGAGKLQFISDSVDFEYTHTFDSDPLTIGSKTFSPGPLEYTCGDIGQRKVVYPEPRKECWKTRVMFDGNYYDMIPGEIFQLNEFMTVYLDPKGVVYFDDELGLSGEFKNIDDWKSVYHFKINEDGLLNTQAVGINSQIKLNSEDDFLFKINNEFYDFNAGNAGAWIRTKHSLLERGESWETKKFGIRHGSNNYLVSPDTIELGKVQFEFQPFIEIYADEKVIIKQPQPTIISYEVVTQLDDFGNDDGNGSGSFLDKIISWIKNTLLGWLY